MIKKDELGALFVDRVRETVSDVFSGLDAWEYPQVRDANPADENEIYRMLKSGVISVGLTRYGKADLDSAASILETLVDVGGAQAIDDALSELQEIEFQFGEHPLLLVRQAIRLLREMSLAAAE